MGTKDDTKAHAITNDDVGDDTMFGARGSRIALAIAAADEREKHQIKCLFSHSVERPRCLYIYDSSLANMVSGKHTMRLYGCIFTVSVSVRPLASTLPALAPDYMVR